VEKMSEQKSGQLRDVLKKDRFIQIGIVVKSIDETLKYYNEVFGLAPILIDHVMETGRIVLTGTGKDLLMDKKVQTAYLGL
jgi:ABC-type branched-subunit amino acid transport system ATPase component